jgi:hypothetical protein
MLLPDPDKLVDLDQRRNVVVSIAENIERATAVQRRSLVELLVERVDVSGRQVRDLTLTSAAAEVLRQPYEGTDRAPGVARPA